ncbi:hypothetical protein [Streptomyces graminofaciens]|nr:hypothetical protein [Streptomyces graminofaciens]
MFAVSGLRVFGTGDAPAPAATRVRARRVDQRTAYLKWNAVEGVTGYTIRYGRHPQKLRHSWQVYERTELDLRSLNMDVP